MRHERQHAEDGARAVAARAPVLLPQWCSKGWADGGPWRVEATDAGALVWRQAPDLEPVVLAAPGTVRDVRVAKAGARVGPLKLKQESVVFVVEGGAPVVLPTDGWVPFNSGGFNEEQLTAGGFRAVAEALGHSDLAWMSYKHRVDEVSLGEAEAKLQPLVLDPSKCRAAVRHYRFLQVSVLTLLLPWTAGGILLGVANWLMFAVSAVITVVIGANMVRGFVLIARARRRFAEPRADVAFAASGLASSCALATTRDGMLYLLGGDGRQSLVPGPKHGGVTTASAVTLDGEPITIDLQPGSDSRAGLYRLASLNEVWWDGPAGAAAVRGWLEASGVEWIETPAPKGAPRPAGDPLSEWTKPPWGGRLAFDLCFGAWAVAFSAVALAGLWPPLCIPGGVLFLAWVVARVHFRLGGGKRDTGQFLAMAMEH